jgi:hypothetical protein
MAYNRSQTYEIINAYHGTLPYWEPDVRIERFVSPGRTGQQLVPLLYRPAIVKTIIQKIDSFLEEGRLKGLLVTGPQGIGKSFSLVNTVIALESTGNYLVTFIPDCDTWFLASDVVDMIAASMGVDTIDEIPDFNQEWLGEAGEENFKKLIDAISSCLATTDKKWVFVFDQVNKLFDKGRKHELSISVLPFPFRIIKTVMRTKRVISVISASANNEAIEQHDRFVKYNHPLNMTKAELVIAYPTLSSGRKRVRNIGLVPIDLLKTVVELTAGVPLYVTTFLKEDNERSFSTSQMTEIKMAWDTLRSEATRESEEKSLGILNNAILSYLMLPTTIPHYDKKYFYLTKNEFCETVIEPIIPIVLDAVRDHYWNQLLEYLSDHENDLVKICKAQRTSGIVRGRLFEHLVINASLNPRREPILSLDTGIVNIPNRSEQFDGNKLPKDNLESTMTYIPKSETFPAVDFVWKIEDTIVGVQVHTSRHRDVVPDFEEMCIEAKWVEQFGGKLYLLYLCHDSKCKRNVQDFAQTTDRGLVKVFARTVTEIDGLNEPKWW